MLRNEQDEQDEQVEVMKSFYNQIDFINKEGELLPVELKEDTSDDPENDRQ